jgi:arylsulfatase A-like enzyme
MIGCQGIRGKHVPWDESIRVPFLIRLPCQRVGRQLPLLMDAPDIMPTLLGLCGLPVPNTVHGRSWAAVIRSEEAIHTCEPGDDEHYGLDLDSINAAFLKVPVPYHWLRKQGITEFRGVRTVRYTYVRNAWGPWLLYDNATDEFQLTNLLTHRDSNSTVAGVACRLEQLLDRWLLKLGDSFEPGAVMLEKAGLDHYWEANVPWQEWSTKWSHAPYMEPKQVARL